MSGSFERNLLVEIWSGRFGYCHFDTINDSYENELKPSVSAIPASNKQAPGGFHYHNVFEFLTWGRVCQATVLHEETSVDSLLHDNEGKLWSFLETDGLKTFHELLHFMFKDCTQLTVADSIPENDDPVRQGLVDLVVLAKCT